jgi:hypothetical protein
LTERGAARGLRRLTQVAFAFGLLLVLGIPACAPGAQSAACRNDGDCPDGSKGRAYCVRRHCVECVTKASCGPHFTCRDGSCVED